MEAVVTVVIAGDMDKIFIGMTVTGNGIGALTQYVESMNFSNNTFAHYAYRQHPHQTVT